MKAPILDFHPTEVDERDLQVPVRAFDWASTNCPRKYWGVRLTLHPNPATGKVREFCSKDGPGVLIMQGPNGTGKTETVCASMTERLDRGLDAGLYISCAYQLCPMVRSSRSFSSKVSEWELFQRYYSVPYLVLDEPGKGDDKVLEKSSVRNILAARYDNGLKTVICTNWTASELVQWLDNDMASRFRENCLVLALDGKDWRGR